MRTIAAVWLIAWYALGALASIAAIGKPREPISQTIAMATVVLVTLNVLAIWILL